MANRIDTTFTSLKTEGRKALITYIVAGDGGFDLTENAILAMVQSGVDIIEIAVPFSDPIAEGKTIQEASLRALRSGTTLKGVFAMVERLRQKTDMPLLLMLYANTIFRTGTEHFFAKCEETGIDGVIVPDLPYEEHEEFSSVSRIHGVHNISLVTPTSHSRIAKIASAAEGFLYCVSSTGVTGMRESFTTDFDAFFGEIAKSAKVPYCVGFGIRNGEAARKMGSYCDGVIVGSAIVNKVAEYGENAVPEIEKLCTELRKGLDHSL